MNIKFENVFINDTSVVVGEKEGNGPLKKYFDLVDFSIDSSFEDTEINMLLKSIDILYEKSDINDSLIDVAIGGELSNQLTTSSYSMRKHMISFIGIYSACSTVTLGIGLAGLCLNNDNINNILVFTSSFNQTAERQFRNPIEYGGEKVNTQTYTSTVAASCLISNNKSLVRVESFTIGKVVDVGFKDFNDFGRAMAPAAIESLLNHFKSTNTLPLDYDLILTGDLSTYGVEIVKNALIEEYGYINNYNDCGLMIYDVNKQNVLAGGSGPGTCAAVTLGYVVKKIKEGIYNKVLVCATGVLMNPTMVNQKNSLPCISHVICLGRNL